MRFSVVTADQRETFYDGQFRVDGGVLTIVHDDADESNLTLSPSFWLVIRSPRNTEGVWSSGRW